jgi:hypothetical protein
MKGKLVKFGSMAAFKVKEYSPEILTIAGIFGLGFAAYKLAKAETKAEQILTNHQLKMADVKNALEVVPDYSEENEKQDTVLVYAQTARDFVVLYGPIVMLGLGSAVAIVGGQKILRKRNIALVAAYRVIDKAFTEYRSRVIDELGSDRDFHFRYGTEYQTLTEKVTDENGKTKKVKKEIQVLPDGFGTDMYARLFEKQVWNTDGTYTGSSQWSPHPDYNALTLKAKNIWANDHLKAHGYLYLNDVYYELGFPRTKAGQIVGWRWQGEGDNYVSFGPEVDALMNQTLGYTAIRNGEPFLLDFNVDGPIIDHMPE